MRRRCPLGLPAGLTLFVASTVLALAGGSPPTLAPAGSAQKARSLDLSAPPVSLVLTPQQIQSLTADQEDDTSTQDVMVKRPVYSPPVPFGPFLALPWALMHPLEAWKIVMPVTDDD